MNNKTGKLSITTLRAPSVWLAAALQPTHKVKTASNIQLTATSGVAVASFAFIILSPISTTTVSPPKFSIDEIRAGFED